MCGILGWISPALTDRAASRRSAERAVTALESRGPDGQRMQWGTGWMLGHTRLAIIDLSPRAGQPMTDGRGLWIVYNGEIYNFRELRAELVALGCRFGSDGDAEVLQALKHWGVACLERLRGMFAFGLLDAERRELILARDRYGVKPLAYDLRPDEFRFASDLFALRALPSASLEVDAESAYLYLGLGYVPAPHSIHRGVRKVRPGHYVRVRWSEAGVEHVGEYPYWSIRALSDHDSSPEPDDGTLLEEFERRAIDAIRYRLISDVPVGTLLSGGIDSTLVTALSRELAGEAIPAFTMGFDDAAYDERPFARSIARRLGGNHAEFQMSDATVHDTWDRLSAVYDEPFADCSAMPTLRLARLVAAHVKVALTGDGGDEIFSGYTWHRALDRLDALWTGRTPDDARLARFCRSFRIPSDAKLDRAALWTILRTGISDEMVRLLPISEANGHPPLSEYFREWSKDLAPVDDCFAWASRIDLLTYLPDDLMVKADRASMSTGLELREPLLDHELTAWCLRHPLAADSYRDPSRSKLLPRRALERRMPSELLARPKQGFTPPLTRWLGGPLSEVVDDALERLRRGRLEPIALPPGCQSWSDCDPALHDVNQDFVWRVVCFSEWLKHAARAA